jgi:holin-like protein
MHKIIYSVVRYIVSFGVIFICLWLGNQIQFWLHLSIPGSVIGMLVLFALLASGILPVSWIQPGANLFIRYMVFLFIPISVGLMTHFETLTTNALAIFASTIGGTLIVLVCMGLILDRFLRRKEK